MQASQQRKKGAPRVILRLEVSEDRVASAKLKGRVLVETKAHSEQPTSRLESHAHVVSVRRVLDEKQNNPLNHNYAHMCPTRHCKGNGAAGKRVEAAA